MDRQYFIWKNPSAQGSTVEWIKLDKQAFIDFLASPESRDRRFVRIGDITIEAPEADYRDWQKEKNHKSYLRKQARGVTVLPLSGNDSLDVPMAKALLRTQASIWKRRCSTIWS